MLGSSLVSALVLLGLASAAPRPNNELRPKWAQAGGHQLAKRSFTIDRVQVGSGQPSAVKAAYKAYSKFGIPVPDALKQAHTKLQKKNKNKKKKGKGKGKGNGNGQGAAGNGTTAAGNGTTAAASGQVGNVTNTPEQGDVEFLAPITVGGQQMVMDFDTGSSDL